MGGLVGWLVGWLLAGWLVVVVVVFLGNLGSCEWAIVGGTQGTFRMFCFSLTWTSATRTSATSDFLWYS